jgi:hypothetical protein
MRNHLTVALILVAVVLVGCERLLGAFMPAFGGQEVALSDKPTVLSSEPTRFAGTEPLKVLGFTSDLCFVLADDVAKDADIDATFQRVKGEARLAAVLHTNGGADVAWKCNGLSFAPSESGHGILSACMRWECNQTPPKGTEITSIDVTSDRPLRVLGVNWSSTAAFDHVSQPPPDLVAKNSDEYRDLEQLYGGKPAWTSPAHTALQVELTSNRRRGSSSFNSTLALRLDAEGIQIQPGTIAIGMGVVTIPTGEVEACSMSCFSNLARSTTLLLSKPGIELDLLNSPEVNDWCWRNRIPMASSASRRAWLYKGAPLPDKRTYVQQFSSRSEYDHQASQSCMGY